MGIRPFEIDMDIISKIPVNPADGGFNTESFRAEFDKAGKLLKEYINTVLIPSLDDIVDVDAFVESILDESLTASDKAAPAKIVGDLLSTLAVQAIVAKTFDKAVHGGDYIVPYDQNLKVEMITATKVRVYGGACIAQGNYVELNTGSYVDLNTASGATGLYRNDLVCVRYQRDDSGNVACSIVLVPGTAAQSGGTDPAVNTGDINAAGAVIHDTPIARLKYSGTSVSVERVAEVYISKTRSTTAVLSASGWSDSAPYTQTITVDGLTDTLFARAYPDVPEDAAAEAALAEETPKVTSCKRSGNAMTFRCREEKPDVDIPVIVEVYV